MTDGPVDAVRSRIMRSVGRTKTKPEMVVRRWLHARGYRFRANVKALPGSPDIVFTARRRAIFVHGCFWHRHPGCRLASTPKTRTAFWRAKFEANVARDGRKAAELQAMGWSVLTIWECETRTPTALMLRVERFVGPTRHLPEARAPRVRHFY